MTRYSRRYFDDDLTFDAAEDERYDHHVDPDDPLVAAAVAELDKIMRREAQEKKEKEAKND